MPGHCLATNGSAYLRRLVSPAISFGNGDCVATYIPRMSPLKDQSPAIHLRNASALTLAHRGCQLQKRDAGAYSTTAGHVTAPGGPLRNLLESLAAHRTSRSGGCLPAYKR